MSVARCDSATDSLSARRCPRGQHPETRPCIKDTCGGLEARLARLIRQQPHERQASDRISNTEVIGTAALPRTTRRAHQMSRAGNATGVAAQMPCTAAISIFSRSAMPLRWTWKAPPPGVQWLMGQSPQDAFSEKLESIAALGEQGRELRYSGAAALGGASRPTASMHSSRMLPLTLAGAIEQWWPR